MILADATPVHFDVHWWYTPCWVGLLLLLPLLWRRVRWIYAGVVWVMLVGALGWVWIRSHSHNDSLDLIFQEIVYLPASKDRVGHLYSYHMVVSVGAL